MGRVVSWVPDSGNFAPFRGRFACLPWLTLRVRLPINAPDRAPLRGRGLSAILMVLSAATLGGWFRDAVGTGECPEWQRELTVNQPSYDFAGSSPASPTSLRSLRELRLGKPAQLSPTRSERRLSRRSPEGRRRTGVISSAAFVSLERFRSPAGSARRLTACVRHPRQHWIFLVRCGSGRCSNRFVPVRPGLPHSPA